MFDGGYWPDESDPLGQIPGFEKFHRLRRKYFAMILIALRLGGNTEEAGLIEKHCAENHKEWDQAKADADFELLDTLRSAANRVENRQRPEVKEKADLDAKIPPLLAFFKTNACFDLPMAERSRLFRQSILMQSYSQVLGERIEAFGSV